MKPPAAAAPSGGEKGGGVDPSLPRFKCQECNRALVVVGVEAFTDRLPAHAVSGMNASSVQGSVMGASRMDNSYVVLSKQNRSHGHGIPPRPPSASAVSRTEPNQQTRPMEGSYIVLPPAAASIYKTPTSEGGGAHLSPTSMNSSSPSPGNNFHASVTVLKRAFEIATSQTQIEQPLCLDCMRLLSDKMDKEIEDVNADIKAYDACLQRLEQETYSILSEADFQKEKQKIEEEEKKLKAAIEEAEKQYSEICSEMKSLELKSKQFEELEERYCHDLNSFQFQLTSHQEERDAVLAKIEVSQVHLELLKRTNVLNDAFYISHDGVIGTINNFRLGRLPNVQVEWDEINAAWGQAALLLHTMAQYFTPKYRIKIHPMGSYPKVTDINNNTYELFGPVNLFWSTRFDKAMTWFLTCLQEFAEFAISLDKQNNVPPEKSLKLPYKIESDKVGSYTIFLSFNKLDNWTKALKYMLCNLKWVLYWFIGNTSFAPPSGSLNVAESSKG
uniref:Beclin 1 protein n=1 Tax=Leersia perrieri TaxID=77586 RepID=A0A0D9VWU3_9ORYZ